MARPPFTVESAEVSARWEVLCKLLQQEQEQNMLDDIQQSVGHLPFVAEADGSPTPTIDCIKSNLGVERDFSEDIEKATEAYNIAVCRIIGPAMHSTLPRELRDMVYAYLTTYKLDTFAKTFHENTKELYVRKYFAEKPEFVEYFAKHPRSENDRLCSERYWRDDVVSSEVAYELMESWYRNSIFDMDYTKVNQGESDECLKALLNKDRFGAGLRPHELITKFTRCCYLLDDAKEADDNVLRCLDDIFLFRKATQLQVSVGLYYCIDKVGALKEYLALIRPTILRLRELGYRCTVLVVGPLVRDLVGKFLKEWELELETEVKSGDSTTRSGV